ncbi:arylsulfatase [Rhodopirellula bahusiensis]|uniref:Arylsulfatase n=1 Tax=Rhodopirellula bahusiensis TaxID=2014065 RepID=A0A2G1WDD6_9BACT|nr:arylsulfatase [Rhodopirellula bahusiensis]PHQ37016.1 arylsulfatase [Rhodopirellula bahusiensis]|tara:strand:- start:717276 stop:719675 length:2400 start_codon:yes stop_codon:yes gene_type:complete
MYLIDITRLVLTATGLASLLVVSCSLANAADKPNVILIVADDQGYGDMSCHGNPILKTPNMDRLFIKSVRLTDFHVAPMCSPTRGQLMTGRDAMKNGCTAVCQGRSMMRADIPTMADFFAGSGYDTGHFGKWHMGDSNPHRPQDRGFQETLHHRAWGITSLADYWSNSYFDPVLNHNGVDKKIEGYCTDIFFDYAMEWIDRKSKVNDDKPFFVYLPTNAPHVPDVCDDKYSGPYVGEHDGKNIPSKFFGMIANLDENLGRLEEFLKGRGLRDDTLLIYMSDNGTQSNEAKELFNAGMRDKKRSVFEGGHRVPCFVRWPNGKLIQGGDVNELTQVQDLLPTLIELCGLQEVNFPFDDSVESQARGLCHFDGSSLAGLLKGTSNELPDRKIVIQYGVSGAKWGSAVALWDKWRLVGPGMLYNIATDPHQDHNVADRHPEIAKAMEEHYDRWHAEAKLLHDIPRWIKVGTQQQNPMMLYAQDWVGDYCDSRSGLTKGTAVGYWNVDAAKAGIYELEFRRWPAESKLPLNVGYGLDFKQGQKGQRPVVAANLQIGGANYTLDCIAEETHVTFRVNLKVGQQRLSTRLLDASDQTLCSAMYVKLTRLPDSVKVELTPESVRKPKDTAHAASPFPNPSPARPVTLAKDDILMADFEGKDFGDWEATGDAFTSGPTEAKSRIVGFQGHGVLDTFIANGSDRPTGTLTSPEFTIDRKQINILIGGGKTPDKTCVNLLVDGKPVRTAIGSATKNAANQKILRWVIWDVSELEGMSARIQIVDQHSGEWGHIVVDQIYRSNQKPSAESK